MSQHKHVTTFLLALVFGWLSGTWAPWKVNLCEMPLYQIIDNSCRPTWEEGEPQTIEPKSKGVMINYSNYGWDNYKSPHYEEDWVWLPTFTIKSPSELYLKIEENQTYERLIDQHQAPGTGYSSARCVMLSLQELMEACNYERPAWYRIVFDRIKITFLDNVVANQEVKKTILADVQRPVAPTKTVKLHKLLALQWSVQEALEAYWASPKTEQDKQTLEAVWNREVTVKCDDNHRPSTDAKAKVPCLYVYTLEEADTSAQAQADSKKSGQSSGSKPRK